MRASGRQAVDAQGAAQRDAAPPARHAAQPERRAARQRRAAARRGDRRRRSSRSSTSDAAPALDACGPSSSVSPRPASWSTTASPARSAAACSCSSASARRRHRGRRGLHRRQGARAAHLRERGRASRWTSPSPPSAAAILVVSQFTLYGDVRRGRRPSFDAAAPPEQARGLYEAFVRELRAAGMQRQHR